MVVDKRHAIAVDGQVGHQQQHFLAVAERFFDEAEYVVKSARCTVQAAIECIEHFLELRFDIVEGKRGALCVAHGGFENPCRAFVGKPLVGAQ